MTKMLTIEIAFAEGHPLTPGENVVATIMDAVTDIVCPGDAEAADHDCTFYCISARWETLDDDEE